MAKDYFQDIVPPDGMKRPTPPQQKAPTPPPPEPEHVHDEMPEEDATPIPIHAAQEAPAPERSIRNINVQRQRAAFETAMPVVPQRRSGGSRWVLWTVAGVCVLGLGALGLVAMRSTVVTVAPRVQALAFTASSTFVAYPMVSAASGTLAYSVRTLDLDDSQVVPSTGTVHADDKATGSITVYNAYSAAPVKLIKNTRFQSDGGLVFRVPADVQVPGKSGATPGQVTVTVVADQAGEQYNVAAGKFTIPGLKSSGAMYTQVYGQSMQAMAGGFSGDRPGVDPAALSSAISQVRDRLETKARDAASQITGSVVVIPDLVQIAYQDQPQTQEAGGGVRIHETAHVAIPVFDQASFVQVVGNTDSTGSVIGFEPGNGFTARFIDASSTLGTDSEKLALTGSGRLIWSVDTIALAGALAGKPQSAFNGIVSQFPGIQSAHARVEPFWKSTFPTDSKSIKVSVEAPSVQ